MIQRLCARVKRKRELGRGMEEEVTRREGMTSRPETRRREAWQGQTRGRGRLSDKAALRGLAFAAFRLNFFIFTSLGWKVVRDEKSGFVNCVDFELFSRLRSRPALYIRGYGLARKQTTPYTVYELGADAVIATIPSSLPSEYA